VDRVAVYVIRVAGPVDRVGPAALEGLRVAPAPDGATTELAGAFADQAALLRLLRALHAAGVPLVGLAREAAPPAVAPGR
jgi:hypothetical protein